MNKYDRIHNTKEMGIVKDLTGNTFGQLIVLRMDEKRHGHQKRIRWVCRCSCGTEKSVLGRNLKDGDVKSCGCLGLKRALPIGVAAKNALHYSYRHNAKVAGRKFELTTEQLDELFVGNCYYCGAKPGNVFKRPDCVGSFTYNGIDRLNSNLGYLASNVVSCCKICNRAKSNLTQKEFVSWIRRLRDHLAFFNSRRRLSKNPS